jgi:hypothetical protein
MDSFSKSELEEAHRALFSTLQKCKKIEEGGKLHNATRLFVSPCHSGTGIGNKRIKKNKIKWY